MDADFEKAKKLAEQIIQENEITSPPIPISLITSNYGLVTGEFDFEERAAEVAGFIDIKKRIIAFNKDDAPQRQAFTIAHELGHYLLHPKETEEKGLDILLRRPLGKPDPDWKEQEANCFAANLLVPEKMLREYVNKNYSDQQLSQAFGVSIDVIGFRKNFLHIT